MDKHELEQLGHLNKEIEIIKKQIEDIELTKHISDNTISDSVVGSSPVYPYTQHVIKIQGIDTTGYYNRLYKLKQRMEYKLNELMDKVEDINEYISTVDDSEMRQILSLRYINGLTWQQVAYHMGMAGDGSTERKKHDRFLQQKAPTD